MRPQVCVVSIGITSQMIANELKDMDLPADFVFNELLLNDQTTLSDSIHKFDVFLSSGLNARILKSRLDKPVITISPSLYDVFVACSQALKYDKTPVVITYRDPFLHKYLHQISNILSIDIKIDEYDRTDTQIEDIVIKYKNSGQLCLIGSGLVCEYAKKSGLHSIYLFPGESIRNSLRTAADMACSVAQNNNRRLQLTAIVNNSKQGIVMLDNSDSIILCNNLAIKLLESNEDEIIGCSLENFILKDIVNKIISIDETNQIIEKIKDTSCVIEVIPIYNKNVIANRLLFLEDIINIQKTERNIRRNVLLQNGFSAKYTFEQYHSANNGFLEFLETAKNFAKSDEPIVISGETGSGKEVLAQSIHNYGSRAGKAFVAVNCAAIPENLLESELFGYNEGAFTGAKKGGKEGYFEMAHMGTIFLDEISEMTPKLQSKILRVIQEKQVFRLGGTKLIPFDARLIVATNQNLWEMAETGSFRKDLYYRLNVLELELPPLRSRLEDLPLLFADFLIMLNPSFAPALKDCLPAIKELLASYIWPGNVRELENFTHILVAYWQPNDGSAKLLHLISEHLKIKNLRLNKQQIKPKIINTNQEHTTNSLKSTEIQHIKRTLELCNGNIGRAASMLGIHRSTLWRKIKAIYGDDSA